MDRFATEPDRPTPSRSCPICGRPAVPERRPFCSSRCAEIDLGRWLKGVYHVPGKEESDEDGTQEPAEE